MPVPIRNGSPNVFAEPTRVSPLSSLLQHNAIKVVTAETELVLHPFCLPGIILIENAGLTDPTAIEKQLALGEHVKKGQSLQPPLHLSFSFSFSSCLSFFFHHNPFLLCEAEADRYPDVVMASQYRQRS